MIAGNPHALSGATPTPWCHGVVLGAATATGGITAASISEMGRENKNDYFTWDVLFTRGARGECTVFSSLCCSAVHSSSTNVCFVHTRTNRQFQVVSHQTSVIWYAVVSYICSSMQQCGRGYRRSQLDANIDTILHTTGKDRDALGWAASATTTNHNSLQSGGT